MTRLLPAKKWKVADQNRDMEEAYQLSNTLLLCTRRSAKKTNRIDEGKNKATELETEKSE